MTAFAPILHRFSEDLNAIQYAFVTHPSAGHVLALAGPGTGKTRVLTYRVAWFLDQGASLDSVLMLTFTNSAADEMLSRATKLAGRMSRKRKLFGGTFHSVANSFLRQHGHHIGLDRKFVILDQADALGVVAQLRSCCASKNLPGKAEILNLISASANSMTAPDSLARAARWPQGFAACIAKEYAAFKRQHNLLDFDDLLTFFLLLLKESETAREKIAAQYHHVFVDEYQDVNRIQAEIVRLLSSHGSVTAVGDDAQSVYSFRGADLTNILRFQDDFPGCAVFNLRHNYRSLSPVIAFTNAVEGKSLYTDKSGGSLPAVYPALDEMQEACWVADKIQALLAEGLDASAIAVLFRAGFHAARLELELSGRGILYNKRGGVKVSDSAHVKDVLAFFRILVNPYDRMAWTRIFLLLDNVGEKTASLLSDIACGGADPFQALKSVSPRPAWQFGFSMLLAVLDGIRPLHCPCDIVEYVIPYVQGYFVRRHPDDIVKRQRGLDWLADLLSGYTDLQMLVDDLTCEPSAEASSEPRLSLYTIHAAKGREWRAVFVIGLTQGLFPDYRAAQLDEERRLFYVACTRASELLFLSWPGRIMTPDRRLVNAPMSPLLRDVSPALYQTEMVPF